MIAAMRLWRVVRSMTLSSALCGTMVLALFLASGCARGPQILPKAEQKTIDRMLVEYPSGFELRPCVRNLTAPTAIAFDTDGSIIIAENGLGDENPHIFGYRIDGTRFEIYPIGSQLPFSLGRSGFRIHGPVGGMICHRGRIYVAHRDDNRRGVITAFNYDGSHITIVADLPAQGDYGITDLAISPGGSLYFGLGAATNSGVVGIDNWDVGWVKDYPNVCDAPWRRIKLLGYRFDTPNPQASIFGGKDIAVTAPFQSFGTSNQTAIAKAPNDKPTAAVYSVSPYGGNLKVEAHGIRLPRGLAFNEYGRLYVTNNGMELRGTRPVKDDPDALLWLVPETWYGWPDYSADLQPISETRFQPPVEMISKTGYPDLSFLIDHQTSGLLRPDRNTLLQVAFPPLSGAAKMDFVPPSGPFKEFHGSVIIALNGDRAPFATGGCDLPVPVGCKVVRVDVDMRQIRDFVYNTRQLPAHLLGRNIEALERPIDVKFGPDGAMYILDLGRMEMKDGREKAVPGTGRIFKLIGTTESAR